jgi:hypothetical protein
MKLNGQWYFAPKAFYWPGKTPVTGRSDRQSFPEQGRDYYDVAIEIFLTGRQRWPEPNAVAPWEAGDWERRFSELQREGLRIERKQISPELERIRFFDAQGMQYQHEYFLATKQRRLRGNGQPGVACDLYPDPKPNALPRCSGGMFWQKDIYADFRFHAQHATDLPAIHQEIVRVLGLAKKVQQ